MKFHLHHHNNNFSNVLQNHTIIGQHKKNYNKAFIKIMRFCLVAITNYRSIKPYFSILKRVVGYYYYLLKIEYATNQLNYLFSDHNDFD